MAHNFEEMQKLIDWIKNMDIGDKTDRYNDVMSQLPQDEVGDAVYSDRGWPTFCDYVKNTQPEKDKQYATAMVHWKDGTNSFLFLVYPQEKLHCEEILIKKLDKILRKKKEIAQHIYIFSLNSPCLGRCMCKLLHKGYEWYTRYKVRLCVAYTKFWGLRGPDDFNYLNYSDISDFISVFFSYYEKCNADCFTLDQELLKGIKKINVFKSLKSDINEKDRHTVCKQISEAKKQLVMQSIHSPYRMRGKHLECGKEIINELKFPPAVHKKVSKMLQEVWDKMVEDSLVILVRRSIAGQFNKKTVHLFQNKLNEILGNNCPFTLRHITH
ncbi:uncharacterized protein LOC130209193 [Pseudoliparis swirei]|uniref:uncharacterized protein LOC130209193 n=1 Tax=Pseudoliparis swirei TaxID=2059687 RepID=UPI0024BE0F8A|nr:uncharacterized protein LOC130209193 [Pseudoliparis swirei]XP_056294659.1 uncharacterized protein LOC130209193 [Pseudoliparis swirei]XP_056294660.1 uncharacterized protein LOC130209193 [Pseudoliparis swirei]XP_056294661.1 uncharacterized protein LOC130209193 [Pseudoliparis swirei]